MARAGCRIRAQTQTLVRGRYSEFSLYCALTTTAVYSLILPVQLLVPKDVIATADGEPNPQLEAETLAEIGVDAPAALATQTD